MPASTKRWPVMPPRQATAYSSTATAAPPPSAASDTGAPVTAEPEQRGHRAGAGALGDADDVGAGQRVAEHRLEQRAGEPEGQADQHGERETRQPQRVDHEVGGPVVADQGASTSGPSSRSRR